VPKRIIRQFQKNSSAKAAPRGEEGDAASDKNRARYLRKVGKE
jgi:hypothetical protein